MQTNRKEFRRYVAQLNEFDSLMIDVARAEGIYVEDTSGKTYIDMLSGICVGNMGHRNPKVIAAIRKQLDSYMHVMVYGEFVQSPQLSYAKRLAAYLPDELSQLFFVNSGSEAIEGAMKLARLHTGRSEMLSMKNSYHGSTLGAVSLLSDPKYTERFRPLIPDCGYLEFNNEDDLRHITEKTACVVTEVIQAGGGVILPKKNYLKKLRQRCSETGTLLILDEIQTGFGRTGSLFAFQQEDFIPDVLCIAKGMGGGMPIGAFVSSPQIMSSLDNDHPLIGHATTFGGNPVCCASALALLDSLTDGQWITEANRKGERYKQELHHEKIKEIRGRGLFLTMELKGASQWKQAIESCYANGIITGTHLFNSGSLALKPPLIITDEEITESVARIKKALDAL
jgi:acetylornithine/N-succinyldiaminopimelate aminotransferase